MHAAKEDVECLREQVRAKRAELKVLGMGETLWNLRHLKQKYYEKGDKADALLAARLRAQRAERWVLKLEDPGEGDGDLHAPTDIAERFAQYYETLYATEAQGTEGAVREYLRGIT